MINILLSGYKGHMGKEVRQLTKNGYRDIIISAGIDLNADGSEEVLCFNSFDCASVKADCIVDFSNHVCTHDLLGLAKRERMPVVLATTGQTEQEILEIEEASKEIPVFFSANMSFGVALLVELAKKTAAAMPDAEIEIIETHHVRKVDAPSGTAKMLAEAIREVRPSSFVKCGRDGHAKREKNEIGMHSLRMGNVVGIHEVIVATQNQTITLKHEAHSRALFAEGALVAAEFLCGRDAGLYTMKDLLKN